LASIFGSLAAYVVMTEVMNTSFEFRLGPVVATLVAATILTLLFGFSATYRALGQKAAPLLRNH
jgi:putative ABC transport system permease protein